MAVGIILTNLEKENEYETWLFLEIQVHLIETFEILASNFWIGMLMFFMKKKKIVWYKIIIYSLKKKNKINYTAFLSFVAGNFKYSDILIIPKMIKW